MRKVKTRDIPHWVITIKWDHAKFVAYAPEIADAVNEYETITGKDRSTILRMNVLIQGDSIRGEELRVILNKGT